MLADLARRLVALLDVDIDPGEDVDHYEHLRCAAEELATAVLFANRNEHAR